MQVGKMRDRCEEEIQVTEKGNTGHRFSHLTSHFIYYDTTSLAFHPYPLTHHNYFPIICFCTISFLPHLHFFFTPISHLPHLHLFFTPSFSHLPLTLPYCLYKTCSGLITDFRFSFSLATCTDDEVVTSKRLITPS